MFFFNYIQFLLTECQSGDVSVVSQDQSVDLCLRGFSSNSNQWKAMDQHGGTEEGRESKGPAAIRKSSSEMSRDLKLFLFLITVMG